MWDAPQLPTSKRLQWLLWVPLVASGPIPGIVRFKGLTLLWEEGSLPVLNMVCH